MSDREFWEPHPFYEDAIVADREIRQQRLAAQRQGVKLETAISARRLSQNYPTARPGLVTAAALLGMDPNDPRFAALSLDDFASMADEKNGGIGPDGTAFRQERARNNRELERGDLPGAARSRSLVSRVFGPVKAATRWTFAFAQMPWEETFSRFAFVTAAQRRHGIDLQTAWDLAPASVLRMAATEIIDGKPVNVGSNWFTMGGELTNETQARLDAGMSFEDAVDNESQAEVGVPLGVRWNAEQDRFGVYFRNGDRATPTPGTTIAAQMYDANDYNARWTAGVLDFVSMGISDPLTYTGVAGGAVRMGATRLLPAGTRGLGQTINQYLASPRGAKALERMSVLAGNPTAISTVIRRAVPHRGHHGAVADAISTVAHDPVRLRSLLEHLNSKAVLTNTFEPISATGYLVRKAALRDPRSLAGRVSNRILDAAQSDRIMAVAPGGNLAALGIRNADRANVIRAMGRIGGGSIAVTGRIRYTPRMDRLIGGVSRVISTVDGGEFTTTLDNYGRSMMLTPEQRNVLWQRAARDVTLREGDATGKAVDQWLSAQLQAGDPLIAREYGEMLNGIRQDNPIAIVADAHRMYASNMARLSGMDVEQADRLNRILSTVFNTAEEMRLYALELNGDPMLHPLARRYMQDFTSGKRYLTATPMDLVEALAHNIPLLDPRAVRMLLRRSGQMGLVGKGPGGVMARLGLATDKQAESVLRFAEFTKGKWDESKQPLVLAIENQHLRKAVAEAETIEDLAEYTVRGTPAIEVLEKLGLRVGQYPELRAAVLQWEQVAKDLGDDFTPSKVFAGAAGDVFQDDAGRTLAEAFATSNMRSETGRWFTATVGDNYNVGEALVRTAVAMQAAVWKPLVMLRPAYITRVIGEEQMRMWFNGYRGIFNSPISFMVLAMTQRQRGKDMGKLMQWVNRSVPGWERGWAGIDAEVGKRIRPALGIPERDMADEIISSLQEFRDAMYHGRQNSYIRGEPSVYTGRFEMIPFGRDANGRVNKVSRRAVVYDVLDASENYGTRLSAKAIYLDHHPDPEEAMRLLLNDPDFADIRQLYIHYGSVDVPTPSRHTFHEGFTGLLIRAYSDLDAPDIIKRLRSQASSLNATSGDVLADAASRSAHMQAYHARNYNLMGIQYARRDINGMGMVLNDGRNAREVLSPETYAELERTSMLHPNELWYLTQPDLTDGPVRLARGTKVALPDGQSTLLSETGTTRTFLYPDFVSAKGDPVATVLRTGPDGTLRARASIQYARNADGSKRVTGIADIEAVMGDDMLVGSMIRDAIEAMEPEFFARATVDDLVEFPVRGRPLGDWFGSLNIQTSQVGLADFLNNPRFARQSTDQTLVRTVPGTNTRLGDWLLEPERAAALPEEIVAAVRAWKYGDEIVDVGDGSFETANGLYHTVTVDEPAKVIDPVAGKKVDAATAPQKVNPEDVVVDVRVKGKSNPVPDKVFAEDVATLPPPAAAKLVTDEVQAQQVARAAVPEPAAAPPPTALTAEMTPAGTIDLSVDGPELSAAYREGRVIANVTGEPIRMPRMGERQHQLLTAAFAQGDTAKARAAIEFSQGAKSVKGSQYELIVKDHETFVARLDELIEKASTRDKTSLTRLKARYDKAAAAAGDSVPSTAFAEAPAGLKAGVHASSGREIRRTVQPSELTPDQLKALGDRRTPTTGSVIRVLDESATRVDAFIPNHLSAALETVADAGGATGVFSPTWHHASFTIHREGSRSRIVIHDADGFRDFVESRWRDPDIDWKSILDGKRVDADLLDAPDTQALARYLAQEDVPLREVAKLKLAGELEVAYEQLDNAQQTIMLLDEQGKRFSPRWGKIQQEIEDARATINKHPEIRKLQRELDKLNAQRDEAYEQMRQLEAPGQKLTSGEREQVRLKVNRLRDQIASRAVRRRQLSERIGNMVDSHPAKQQLDALRAEQVTLKANGGGRTKAMIAAENEFAKARRAVDGLVSRGAMTSEQLGVALPRNIKAIDQAIRAHSHGPKFSRATDQLEAMFEDLLAQIDAAPRPPSQTLVELGDHPEYLRTPWEYRVRFMDPDTGQQTTVRFAAEELGAANDLRDVLERAQKAKLNAGMADVSHPVEVVPIWNQPTTPIPGRAAPGPATVDELPYDADIMARADAPDAPAVPDPVDDMVPTGAADDEFLDDMMSEFDEELAAEAGLDITGRAATQEAAPFDAKVSYQASAIHVKDGVIDSPLFSTRLDAGVESAMVRRLLAEADAHDVALRASVRSRDMAMYEQLGFEVVEAPADPKLPLIMERPAGSDIPKKWPRENRMPRVHPPNVDDLPVATPGARNVYDHGGDLVGRADTPEHAQELIAEHIKSNLVVDSVTKDTIKEAYRILHESNPHRFMSPADLVDALDRSGQLLRTSTRPSRPGFHAASNQRLDELNPGQSPSYWDIEQGPNAYFPLPDLPVDTKMMEAIARRRALAETTKQDYIDAWIADNPTRAANLKPDEIERIAITRSENQVDYDGVSDLRHFDESTGREIIADFEGVRGDILTEDGRRTFENRIAARVEDFTNVNDWHPDIPNGVGRSKLRSPEVEQVDRMLHERVTTWAFDIITSRPANMLSRGPVWADMYTEAIAELYPFATPEVREEIIKYFRKTGLHGGRNDVQNLTAALMGRRKFADMSTEQIEQMLLRQSKQAQSGGGITLGAVQIDEAAGVGAPIGGLDNFEDLNIMAQKMAAERVQALLFDSSQRAQIFDQMAIIFPFGDAFAELASRWFKAFATSPYRGRNAARMGRSIRALNGGMHDDEGLYSDDAGLVYSDPYSGDNMMLLPWSTTMSQMVTGDSKSLRMGVNLDGLSPISTAMVPGLGPMVGMAASALPWQKYLRQAAVSPRDSWERRLYDQIFPFGLTDYELGGTITESIGVPGWMTRFWNGTRNRVSSATEATAGSEGVKRTLNNLAMELLRAGVARGDYDMTTETSRNDALVDAMDKAAQVEVYRSFGLFVIGGNSPSVRIPTELKNVRPSEIAAMDDQALGTFLTYLTPLAYAREYQNILENEAEGDYVQAGVTFAERYGFEAALVRTSRSVELAPSPVTSEGRLFALANQRLTQEYPLAAYYLQPDPPASDFDYNSFRFGLIESNRESLTPRMFAYALNNAIGNQEYQKKYRELDAMYERGDIQRMDMDVAAREYRRILSEKFPGYGQTPSFQKPKATDIANQIHRMVTEMGPDLYEYQMGPLLAQVDQVITEARRMSVDQSKGEWAWATGQKAEDQMIRNSVRSMFERLAQQDPRVAILWNEVYSRILVSSDPMRGSIFTDDPYFKGFEEDDSFFDTLPPVQEGAAP